MCWDARSRRRIGRSTSAGTNYNQADCHDSNDISPVYDGWNSPCEHQWRQLTPHSTFHMMKRSKETWIIIKVKYYLAFCRYTTRGMSAILKNISLAHEHDRFHDAFDIISLSQSAILVPRAHDPFGLRQGSRPLAGTEAGSPHSRPQSYAPFFKFTSLVALVTAKN